MKVQGHIASEQWRHLWQIGDSSPYHNAWLSIYYLQQPTPTPPSREINYKTHMEKKFMSPKL